MSRISMFAAVLALALFAAPAAFAGNFYVGGAVGQAEQLQHLGNALFQWLAAQTVCGAPVVEILLGREIFVQGQLLRDDPQLPPRRARTGSKALTSPPTFRFGRRSLVSRGRL